MSGRGWSKEEARRAARDYFEMLRMEINGESFSKADRNRRLRVKLHNRSRGSVEWKHQNISAILLEMNLPPIDGYKPHYHYQELLKEAVEEELAGSPALLRELDRISRKVPPHDSFMNLADPGREVPPPDAVVGEGTRPRDGLYPPHGYDFPERDARNARLGELGERFVVEVEKQKLKQAGRDDLARRVLWASKEKGDDLGYDIESFDPSEERRCIEVKTTNFGSRATFFVSRNEVETSQRMASVYTVCRLFHFYRDPRFFVLNGAVNKSCRLEPYIYLARP